MLVIEKIKTIYSEMEKKFDEFTNGYRRCVNIALVYRSNFYKFNHRFGLSINAKWKLLKISIFRQFSRRA